MVNNSSEKTPTADYKFADTWVEPYSTIPSSDITTTANSSSETPLLVPEGDQPQPDLMPDSEGGSNNTDRNFEIYSSQDRNISEQNDCINLETAVLHVRIV